MVHQKMVHQKMVLKNVSSKMVLKNGSSKNGPPKHFETFPDSVQKETSTATTVATSSKEDTIHKYVLYK
jgi:hypothetical protein